MAGRPKKEDKKRQINIKLPPYLIEWLDRQPEKRPELIETALKAHYKIEENYLEQQMKNKEIKIGETFMIGVGTYNCETKMNDEYVEAEVIELNAYDDKDYFKLKMTEFGGSIQKCHRSHLTKRT